MTGPLGNVCFRPIVPISAQDANGSNRCRTAIYTAKLTRFADRVSTFN